MRRENFQKNIFTNFTLFYRSYICPQDGARKRDIILVYIRVSRTGGTLTKFRQENEAREHDY